VLQELASYLREQQKQVDMAGSLAYWERMPQQ